MSVRLSGTVSKVLSNLILLVIVSELRLMHNRLSHWNIDVMRWHRMQSSSITPEIGKHFKSIDFLEPLLVNELVMDFFCIGLLSLLIELLRLNDVLRRSFSIVFIIHINLVQIKLVDDFWIVLTLIQKCLFMQKEVFVKRYLRIYLTE